MSRAVEPDAEDPRGSLPSVHPLLPDRSPEGHRPGGADPYYPGMRPEGPIAVVDIGSNSGRVVIFRLTAAGHVELLRETRVPLRLARELPEGRLGPGAIERTASAIADFATLVAGSEADGVLAVATSAIRESANADELLEVVRRQAGISLEVIDGEAEARYAFLGAVHGLPVHHGFLIDIGGGSVEIARFRDRSLKDSWTLPLGSLRMSDTFLRADPPSGKEQKALLRHVDEILEAAGLPEADDDEVLVGTGGTIRNVGKVDRARRAYPVHHLHGYRLDPARVREIADMLADRPAGKRASLAGMNADRADSIVGGARVFQRIVERLGVADIWVSGQGLREGIVLGRAIEGQLPPPDHVRRSSVQALATRFRGWSEARAERRVAIATGLLDVTGQLSGEVMELVEHAAHLLDIGTNIDYYNRHQHTAQIVADADLAGFSHRGLAMLSALLWHLDKERPSIRSLRPLVGQEDRRDLVRAGTALALAEQIDWRLPPDVPAPRWQVDGREAYVAAPALARWRPRALAPRFQRSFGLRLALGPDDS